MKPIDDKVETVTFRAVSRDEEGRKRVERVELNTHNMETIKHVEKKLMDKGIQRMERHPGDGLSYKLQPHKAGHGGKFTWEGPVAETEAEMDPVPAAVDEGDPNYVEEVAASQEVARMDLDPRLDV